MSHLTLPGQLVLHVTWPNLLLFLQVLRLTLEGSGWLRTLLVVGEDLQLCQDLKQLWDESGEKTRESIEANPAVWPGKYTEVAEPASLPTSVPLSANSRGHRLACPTGSSGSQAMVEPENRVGVHSIPIITLTGVEASLVVISSHLNVWMQVKPLLKTGEEKGEGKSGKEEIPLSNFQILTSNFPDISVRVSLVFDPYAIAQLLSSPSVAAAAPHCSELTAADLENNSHLVRRFWMQLQHLVERDETAQGSAECNTWQVPSAEESRKWETGRGKKDMPVTSNFKSPISNLPPELVNSLFWGSPMGILYESLDGGILSANPAFCSLTGYTETQLRHLDIRSISHPQDFAAEVRLIQQMIQGGSKQQSLRKRYLSRNGTLVWTESTLMLVGEEAEESYLLTFVKDLSDRAAAEQELQQRRQREALLSELTAQIRSTFDLPTILQLAVKRLRQALDTDRVVAVELMSDRSGVCVAEDVNPAYPPMKGQSFPADRISLSYLEPDRCAHLWSLPDVQAEIICESERQLLNQVQVRSMMVVGIQRTEENGHLGVRCGEKSVRSPYLPHSTPTTHWGLLWVHHCHAPRQWTADEQQLVEAVANQMAIAIEQANLVYQLQAYARELEDRVSQRTRSLERSLQFEQLIRHLTETLCIATDEDEVLKAAVEGLVQTLDVDSGYACLYNEQQEIFEVRYEHALGNPGTLRVGQRFPLQNWQAPCQQQVLWGEMCIQQSAVNAHSRGGKPSESAVSGRSLGLKPLELIEKQLTPDNLRTSSANVSSSSFDKDREPLTNWLISPILDERGLIGAVCLFQSLSYDCDASVIKLVKQVTVQCAIAIRQIRLTRKEHSSRVSAEYFRSFLDQSSNVFVEYDPQLRYLSINPAGAKYLGQPAAEIIGKTTQELIGVGAEAIEPLVRQVFNTGQRLAINHDICLPAGVRTFETVYAPIADATGTIHRVIGVGQDVTEYRQQWQLLEEQNQQLAAMNGVKEEFIATTSHELRTPLTAILGFSSVLNQQSFGPLNPKQKDYIERIHSSGQHLLELINDILDLSRIEADRLDLELQLVFMKELCESVIALIQERATNQGLTLKVEVDPELEYIIVDPRRLKQMLLNLLTNAIKFTPKGSIGLKIYRAPCSPASINAGSAEGGRFTRTERKGSSPTGNRGNTPRDCTSLRQDTRAQDMIHFMVWDTGIGIDERDQPRLFAPFSQIDSSLSRQYQGTGLGLAITRKLAELHGGWITLESHRDEGSCFTISLPLQETSKALLPRDRQLER